ncbi:MAG: hypothetical protein HOQ11_17550 [Gemmatimonadaceae bacterium]|nr:hypothetical protein [Gemmatimonadaceae bacterium]NUS99211.1 hypothetical protein [Gemmatimonadaceae bacterium]
MAALVLVAACSDAPVGPRGLPCARGTLARGTGVESTIAGSACTTTEGSATRAYADYDVDLTEGERYVFTLRSSDAWKPLLELRDPSTGAFVRSGWVTGAGEAGTTAEMLYVAPQSGRFTLRVREADSGAGAYTLHSQICGGSSTEIFSSQTVGAEGTIDAADCVVHDRWLDADSAHAETFVVYVNRAETKRVTLAARGGSTFVGAVIVVGAFERDASAWTRAVASGASQVSLDLTGPSDKGGTYMIVAAGNTIANLGDYTLTVGPPAP